MKLRVKKVTHFEVGYSDLEALIKHEYGHNYSVIADLEASNDSKEEVQALKGENNDDDQEEIANYRATGSQGDVSIWTLMNDMADRGVIEEGDYLIDICW
jgi:hypothetical protein